MYEKVVVVFLAEVEVVVTVILTKKVATNWVVVVAVLMVVKIEKMSMNIY